MEFDVLATLPGEEVGVILEDGVRLGWTEAVEERFGNEEFWATRWGATTGAWVSNSLLMSVRGLPPAVETWPLLLLSVVTGLVTDSILVSVSFMRKIIDLPGGQINDSSSGKHYSLTFLPATPSSPSRTLEGLFEPTKPPSRALDSPGALLPELRRYKGTVRWVELGAEVPVHYQKQWIQTLIVSLL